MGKETLNESEAVQEVLNELSKKMDLSVKEVFVIREYLKAIWRTAYNKGYMTCENKKRKGPQKHRFPFLT